MIHLFHSVAILASSEFNSSFLKESKSIILEESAQQVEARRTILIKSITSYDDSELGLKVEPLFRHTKIKRININLVSS
jgi:hypothetical protein